MRSIRKDDLVQIMAGKDRGRQGRILRVFPKEGKAIVEGAAVSKRHQKASQTGGPAGIVEKSMKIHLSNLMPIDPKSSKPTRVRFSKKDDTKLRMSVKSNEVIGAGEKTK